MAVSEAPCRSSIRLGLACSNSCKFYSKLICNSLCNFGTNTGLATVTEHITENDLERFRRRLCLAIVALRNLETGLSDYLNYAPQSFT